MDIFNFYYVSVRAIRNTLWKCSHCIDFTYNRRIEIFLEHRHLEIFLKLFSNENEVLNKVYAQGVYDESYVWVFHRKIKKAQVPVSNTSLYTPWIKYLNGLEQILCLHKPNYSIFMVLLNFSFLFFFFSFSFFVLECKNF